MQYDNAYASLVLEIVSATVDNGDKLIEYRFLNGGYD